MKYEETLLEIRYSKPQWINGEKIHQKNAEAIKKIATYKLTL